MKRNQSSPKTYSKETLYKTGQTEPSLVAFF